MKLHTISLLIVCFFTITASAQDAGNHPMFYYYDPLEHAYVIQKPGASDGWLFGAGIIPPEHNSKAGPGWSPSAEWFAITSGQYFGYGGAFVSSIQIMNREGTKSVNVLDEVQAYSLRVDWSPTDDLLLVYSPDEYIEDMSWPLVMVVDPNADEIIMSFDHTSSAPQWSPDGRYIHFFRTIDPEDYQSRRESVFAAITGEVITQPVYTKGSCGAYWAWHPDGRYVSLTPDGTNLVIEDLSTRSTNEVLVPSNDIQQIEWSSDGRYGLLYSGAPCGTPASDTQLWLLDMTTLNLRLIHDDVYAVEIDDFLYNYDSQLLRSWSPDSRKALYWTGNGIFVFDIESGQTIQFPIDTRANLENLKVRWFDDSDRVAVSWGDDLYVYSIMQNDLLLLTDNVRNFDVSPDGNYVVVFGTEICPLSFICVLDARSSIVIGSIAPPSTARDWGGQVEFSWHPNSQWLIVGLQQNLDTGRKFLMISDITGDHRRELSLCYVGAACVGWVTAPDDQDGWGAPFTPTPLPDTEINLGAVAIDIEWTQDGKQFAVALAQEILKLDANTLDELWSFKVPEDEFVQNLEWRGDFLLAEIEDTNYTEWGNEDRLVVIESSTGNLLQEYRTSEISRTYRPSEIQLGISVIAIRNYSTDTVEIWDWQNHEMIFQQGNISQFALSDDNKLAILDSQSGTIQLWQIDLLDGVEKLAIIEPEMSADIVRDPGYYSLLITADGNHVILGRSEQTVSIWDANTGEFIETIPMFRFTLSEDRLDLYVSHSSSERTLIPLGRDNIPESTVDVAGQIVHYSPDTRRLITFEQPTITVWNLNTNEAIFTRDVWLAYTHTAPVSVSLDGRYMALSGEIGLWGEDAIEIYDFQTLELVDRYNRTGYGFTWSPDGNILAVETMNTMSLIKIP